MIPPVANGAKKLAGDIAAVITVPTVVPDAAAAFAEAAPVPNRACVAVAIARNFTPNALKIF
jgi:hypothetical protein